jgi:hypothetical protein
MQRKRIKQPGMPHFSPQLREVEPREAGSRHRVPQQPTRIKIIDIPHPKIRGEWVELRFMTRAIELRFRPSCPWRDSAPYDVVTEFRGRFRRIQVKCTTYARGNSFKCHLDHNGTPYSPKDIDFIAAYIIPTETWYILPIRATNRQPDILLTPNNPNSKYAKYQEAWHLLKK